MPRHVTQRTLVSAGYMPLDVITDGCQVWRRAGGTAGNVAAITAFLGWQSALAGRIGNDPAAAEFVADLARAGVDLALVKREHGGLTNRLIHHASSTGHRYAYTCPHCSQRLPRSRPLTLSQVDEVVNAWSSPTVYFFDRANAATVELAERYAASGSLVVFEPSTPANAELIQRAIAAAGIVKGSAEHGPELVATYRTEHPDQLRVITDGGAGASFRLGAGSWQRVGVYEVALADAAGAGDWTTAGLIHHLAGRGAPNEEAILKGIEFGHSLAALNCALPGARGLMDARARSSVLALATRLRQGEYVVPARQELSRLGVPAGHCAWCLLAEADTSVRAQA